MKYKTTPEMFERFYSKYPVKKSRGAAIKSFEKVMAGQTNEEQNKFLQDLLSSIDSQLRYEKHASKLNQFHPPWKMPSTWLNQQCWLDQNPMSHSRLEIEGDKAKCEQCDNDAAVATENIRLCARHYTKKYSDLSLLNKFYKEHKLKKLPDESSNEFRLRMANKMVEFGGIGAAMSRRLKKCLIQG